MRATAILFVVFSHVLWIFPEASGVFVDLLRLMGVMGVEIFFVLSGFLIGRILFRIFTKETFKPKDLNYFLIRRWFRTLPNYYLALLINIGIVYYFGREQADSLWRYFFFLQNAVDGMDIFFTESWSYDNTLINHLSKLSEAHPREGFWKSYYRLRNTGEIVNHKRLHRVYKQMGLPLRRKAKKRLPARVKEPITVPSTFTDTWSIDFMSDALSNGSKFRSFNVIDDYNREILHIETDYSLKSSRVIWILNRLCPLKNLPISFAPFYFIWLYFFVLT